MLMRLQEVFSFEMIKDGESTDKIRKYTGLTDEEIEGLRMRK